MNILIAPDSMKDCLSAPEVAAAISKGIQKAFSKAKIVSIPMADGGEGTAYAMVKATDGTFISNRVHDPLMRPIHAQWGILGDGQTAIIELAAASGLQLLKIEERNPWLTSSFGTGELIKYALDKGCKNIIIALGGSATNDGGAGIMQALGARLTTEQNQLLKTGGGYLQDLHKIDLSELDPRLEKIKITLACDVKNPLTGPEGASRVYAKQKGADDMMASRLDTNLILWAHKIKQAIGKDIEKIPGSGAAGGTCGGLMGLLNADIKGGFHMVAEAVKLETAISKADIIFTAEGKADKQTLQGKTPLGIAEIAQKYQKTVFMLCGSLEAEDDFIKYGIHTVPIVTGPCSLDYAIQHAPLLLENAAARIARLLK
ncbi:MAG: glycerate kinase [Cytophagaceae bacterium]